MARKHDSPENWSGTRTVAWNAVPCGWCIDAKISGVDSYHERCKHETAYYEKLWLCSCPCNSEWKPVAVVVNKDGTLGEVPADLEIGDKIERKRTAKNKATAEVEQSDDSDDQVEIVVYDADSGQEIPSSFTEAESPVGESVSEEAKSISESPHS